MKKYLWSTIVYITLIATIACSGGGGGSSNSNDDDNESEVTVISISPMSGRTGTTVTIRGSGFVKGNTLVTFDGVNALDVNVKSSSQLEAKVPFVNTSLNTNTNITVSVGSESDVLFEGFDYVQGIVISTISPSSGGVGTFVTITGDGFIPGVEVAFDGVEANNVEVIDSTKITATVPQLVNGSVDVLLTLESEEDILSNGFTYTIVEKIYWAGAAVGTEPVLFRSNLDGSDTESLVSSEIAISAIITQGIALDLQAGKVYWIERDGLGVSNLRRIRRANLNGSNVENLVESGLSAPRDIALDTTTGKMYWTDNGNDTISRANLDGSDVENLITSEVNPIGIALDIGQGKMYWADNSGIDSSIKKANLDGSDIEGIIDVSTTPFRGIAIDSSNDKMYWTLFLSIGGGIRSASLDGSDESDILTSLKSPQGIALNLQEGKIYWSSNGTSKDLNKSTVVIQKANLDGTGLEDVLIAEKGPGFGIALQLETTQNPLDIKLIPKGTSVNIEWKLPKYLLPNISKMILLRKDFHTKKMQVVDIFNENELTTQTQYAITDLDIGNLKFYQVVIQMNNGYISKFIAKPSIQKE